MTLRYQGYLSTPLLWQGIGVSPFQQVDLPESTSLAGDSIIFKQSRLGKLVEEFVFHQLKKQDSISWICDNLQIQDGKRTVGEIDALYYEAGTPIHLEVAYKFYLYDTLENNQETLANWIGPNRKDNLFYKLNKLHTKQFPLLHNALTSHYLERYDLEADSIKQLLCFKAQLFLPYRQKQLKVAPLHSQCIAGIYISFHQLPLFSTYTFFIPTKLDWLVTPHHDVTWIDYPTSVAIIEAELNDKRSPMAWVKQGDGKIIKCFIVFW